MVDTSEFDEQENISRSSNDSDGNSDSEVSEGEQVTDIPAVELHQNELANNEFDDTMSSAPENEIFFNFRNAASSNEPSMMEMVKQMVGEQLTEEKEKLRTEYNKLAKLRAECQAELDGQTSHKGGNEKQNKNMKHKINHDPTNPIKSPSDTTIYAPALTKERELTVSVAGCKIPVGKSPQGLVNDYQHFINDFVDQMRKQHDESRGDRRIMQEGRAATATQKEPRPGTSNSADTDPENIHQDDADDPRTIGRQNIVDAEVLKVSVEKPIGNPSNLIVENITDDNFFHLTCHLDDSLTSKIKKGQYVDLEKLLPNSKFIKRENTKLELHMRDGATYSAPADRERRINNVCQWDQAFRVFASIYCREHPGRAGEIWQYMEVIHTAAAAYVWENVAHYDYIFRQLMEFNPKCSWSTTYTQMWNLALVEPHSKHNNNSNNGGGPSNQNKRSNNGQNKRKSGGGSGNNNTNDIKDDYCWALNGKVNHCHFGSRCRYINKCSYCDSPHHGITKCPKLEQKSKKSTNDEQKN